MIQTRMFGVSECHRGTPDKLNEDAYLVDDVYGVAIVADGVSLLRRADGSYPGGAHLASAAFVRAVRDGIVQATATQPEVVMREAMRCGNVAVAEVNRAAGIVDSAIDCECVDYLSTTGCVLWAYEHGGKRGAILSSIGDSLALYVPRRSDAQLLTRDQLTACHRYSHARFREVAQREGLSREEEKRRRIVWQRREARNRKDAVDSSGTHIGYGVMTGELAALEVVDIRSVFPITPGDRFLLASDALRVLATPLQEIMEETAADYQSVVETVRRVPSESVPSALIERIRVVERHSDDATVVLVEVL